MVFEPDALTDGAIPQAFRVGLSCMCHKPLVYQWYLALVVCGLDRHDNVVSANLQSTSMLRVPQTPLWTILYDINLAYSLIAVYTVSYLPVNMSALWKQSP